jgi:hypothetical protein
MAHISPEHAHMQPVDPVIPGDTVRLALSYPFGPFFKAYKAEKPSRAMFRGCLLMVISMVVLPAIPLILSFLLGLPKAVVYPVFIVVLNVLLGLAWRTGLAIHASGTEVYLFRNGIIYSKGAQRLPLFWQQIEGVQKSWDKYLIRTRDGRTITLYPLNDLDELTSRIQQALAWKPQTSFYQQSLDQRPPYQPAPPH